MSINNLHGGDLDAISRIYNIPKNSIINFGGNVNPLGLPHSVKEAIANDVSICENYPDVSYLELRKAIGSYAGVNPDYIVPGNGSSELISGYIKYVKPKKALIISPAYSEYLKEINVIGGEAIFFKLSEDNDFVLDISSLINELSEDIDLLVMCNPNNPTGSFIGGEGLRLVLEHCNNNNIKVMIDETYVEFSDPVFKVSAVPLVKDFKNLFIIRGTSKFFACPGLRLGYGISSDGYTLASINSHKDLWSVNVFADLAGRVMFGDKKFITDTLSLIISERKRFIMELGALKSLKLYNTQSNFFLAKIIADITSDDVFNKLIEKGILIRNCKDFPFLCNSYIRFCILSKDNNTLLIENIKDILRGL